MNYAIACELQPQTRMSSNPSFAHRMIADAFSTVQNADFIWRMDPGIASTGLLIIGNGIPNMSKIDDRFGCTTIPVEQRVRVYCYDDLLSDIEEGTELGFSLRANPTRRYGHKILPMTDDDLFTWISVQGEKNGFAPVPNHLYILSKKSTAFRDYANLENKITFKTVLYSGRIIVTDKNLFRYAAIHGIGREKTYGQGLLLLDPSVTESPR